MCEIINELYNVNKIRCGYINFKWLMIPMAFEVVAAHSASGDGARAWIATGH